MQNIFSNKSFQSFSSISTTSEDSDFSGYQKSAKSLSNQDKYLLLLQNVLLDGQDGSSLSLDSSYNMNESFQKSQSSNKKNMSSTTINNKNRMRDGPNFLDSLRMNDSTSQLINNWNSFSIKSTNNFSKESPLFPNMKELR